LVGVFSANHLNFKTDSTSYHLATEKQIETYQKFIDQLGQDTIELDILILEKADGWRSLEDFQQLKTITEFWRKQTKTKNLYSIVDLEYPRKSNLSIKREQFLNLNDSLLLLKRLEDYEAFADIFEKFLSRNRKYALVFMEVDEITSLDMNAYQAMNYEVLGIQLHYLQYDLIEQEIQSYLKKDSFFLGLASLILILIAFFLFTYSLKGLGLIVLMVLFNVSVTIIFIKVFGLPYTVHMITVPCMITILSFTDIMHILYHQHALASTSNTVKELRNNIFKKVSRPMLLTSLTNIFGLLVFLMLSEAKPLLNYALVSIFGIATAYLSSRFLVIRLMELDSSYIKRSSFDWLYKSHHKLYQWFDQKMKFVVSVFIVLSLAMTGVVGTHFQIDSNTEKDFTIGGATFNHAKEILDAHFFGKKQGEVFIHIKNGTMWDLNTLHQISEVEQKIEEIFDPPYLNSPVLMVKRCHRFYQNGRKQGFVLPKKMGKQFTMDLKEHRENLGGIGIVDPHFKAGRILYGYSDENLSQARVKYQELSHFLQNLENENISFELSGLHHLTDEATYNLSRKLLWAFGASILLSCIILMILLRSVRIGLGILLANSFPILLALGIIIFMDYSITPLTLFLLSILLGVCLDDSIYIISNGKKGLKTHLLPIFITSIVLAIGFSSLSLSNFPWLKPFGGIFFIGLIAAFLIDILILPLFLSDHQSAHKRVNG